MTNDTNLETNETTVEELVKTPIANSLNIETQTKMPIERAILTTDDAPFDPKTGLVPRTFTQLLRLADIFARSKMVPAHFQNKPDDCFVALQMAYRMELDPMTALQNIYVVSGKPGLSSQLIISLVNRSKKLIGPIQWRVKKEIPVTAGPKGPLSEQKEEIVEVTAFGTLRETNEEISFTVPWLMVKTEGWCDRNPKYRSMPEVMMRYRAAVFLARFHFSDVVIGMHSAEELEDVSPTADIKSTSTIDKMLAQAQELKQ